MFLYNFSNQDPNKFIYLNLLYLLTFRFPFSSSSSSSPPLLFSFFFTLFVEENGPCILQFPTFWILLITFSYYLVGRFYYLFKFFLVTFLFIFSIYSWVSCDRLHFPGSWLFYTFQTHGIKFHILYLWHFYIFIISIVGYSLFHS